MKFTDGLQIAAGILAALFLLAASVFGGVILGPLVVVVPFLVLIFVGGNILYQRWGEPAWPPFQTGLLIGACLGLLICTTCDIYMFGGYMKW